MTGFSVGALVRAGALTMGFFYEALRASSYRQYYAGRSFIEPVSETSVFGGKNTKEPSIVLKTGVAVSCAIPSKGATIAVYLLYNIEVPTACADEMEHQFRINDSVLRYMLVRRDEAVTEKSVIMTETEVAQKAQGEKSHGGGHSRRGSTGERKSAAPAIADEVKSTDSQSPASKAQISADAPATPTAPTPPTPPTPTAPAPTADVAATPESNASGGNAG